MPKFHSYRLRSSVLAGVTFVTLSSCSTAKDFDSIDPSDGLNAVAETSGLLCDDNTLWTINDSGNTPTIYQLKPLTNAPIEEFGYVSPGSSQPSNKISRLTITGAKVAVNGTELKAANFKLQSFATDATNQDWEALTLHNNKLIIGDIGNNNGQRKSVRMYLFEWPLHADIVNVASVVDLPLLDGTANVLPYQHNGDAEALVSSPQGLFMFSKNWLADESTVYLVDLTNRRLQPQANIKGLPGIVTDAAWTSEAEVFLLTGYRNTRMHALMFALTGDFQPFLAVVDINFNLIKTIPLASKGQIEGICIDKQQNVWLSQEDSGYYAMQFWRWGSVLDVFK